MGLLLESTLSEVSCVILLVLSVLYFYVTMKFSFWSDRGIPYNKPLFPFGSVSDFFLGRKHIGEMYNTLYNEFENEPYFGIFEGRNPVFVVKEPSLIKSILTKDFHHFVDRLEPPEGSKSDYLIKHLFNMRGKEWKRMRLKLTPTFTSGKMKAMFVLMRKCGQQLKAHVETEVRRNPEIDVKDDLMRFTMDIIASCAFGLEINSLNDKDCEFYHVGMKIFTPTFFTKLRRIILVAVPFMTKVYTTFFSIIPADITNFLTKIVRDTVRYREENNVNRNDFLDLLIKIRQNKSLVEESNQTNGLSSPEKKDSTDNKELTVEEITAQAFIFFAAGFETASSTMTFCLYELARNLEVQDKLYQEIKLVLSKHDGELTYQAVQDMTYMDKVVNETLRLYASLAVLNRLCTEPYKIPDTDIILEKGQRVIIPTYAIHHDSKYYPEPLKFDPERFSPEKVKERHSYVHLPFGEGPRMCIGMRFGLLQTKIGLSEMVLSFKFALSPATLSPIALHKSSFVTQPEKRILLLLSEREN